MKSLKLFPLCSAVALLSISPPAFADNPQSAIAEPQLTAPDISFDVTTTANLNNTDAPVFGAGIGLNAFFTRNLGVGVELWTENAAGKVFDGANASLLLRVPISERLAPYAFAGGGYLFERNAWQAHVGAGLEVKITAHASIIGDARWITALREASPDYALARAGLRFHF